MRHYLAEFIADSFGADLPNESGICRQGVPRCRVDLKSGMDRESQGPEKAESIFSKPLMGDTYCAEDSSFEVPSAFDMVNDVSAERIFK